LGSPNFTHIPINAPKCPFAHFQQDGHMAMRNPVGRTNYEPNSRGEGPREDPVRGFRSFREEVDGPKVRLRAESFADHYSQARQFFNSQTVPEQKHIAMALTFELSKVEAVPIRERMVAHLLVIDEALGATVADKLGMYPMPKPADAAVSPRDDLPASPALSIILNGPESFTGRKVGVLVSNGCDAGLLKKLRAAVEKEGATMELVAPKVGGVEASDGSRLPAHHMIDGGPSVLFDAVVLLLSEEGAERLTGEAAARDFVADAFAHCKFIGFTAGAVPLLAKAGVAPDADEGMIALEGASAIPGFIESCRKLRLWAREGSVKL
ncbi:MAG: catalase, partial [Rhizobiales bacterium]|nr:catalase [Hyphomicrobiales bacterium]